MRDNRLAEINEGNVLLVKYQPLIPCTTQTVPTTSLMPTHTLAVMEVVLELHSEISAPTSPSFGPLLQGVMALTGIRDALTGMIGTLVERRDSLTGTQLMLVTSSSRGYFTVV